MGGGGLVVEHGFQGCPEGIGAGFAVGLSQAGAVGGVAE